MKKVSHKRGDTFIFSAQVKDEDESSIDLTGWQIRSQIRKENFTVVDTLVITITDAVDGKYQISSNKDPNTLPLGEHHWDIEFTDSSGRVISTETLIINIVEDITL
jgi:hypothetical protein